MSDPSLDALEATAQTYDELLAPALFQPLARLVVEKSGVSLNATVLDVGCGGGALTRELVAHAGADGRIVGADANPGMIAVARKNLPTVRFCEADAASLPFESAAFDIVTSQFALMLFDQRQKALEEMWRVLAPGGQMTVAVFDGLESNRAYGRIADIYETHVGSDIANVLRFPFSMGDVGELESLFANAGIAPVQLFNLVGRATFNSCEHLARADIDGWFPFAGLSVAEPDVKAIIDDFASSLIDLTANDGSISFDTHAHVVTATKAHY